MKIEKIDIKKEFISIPDGQNFFEWINPANKIFDFSAKVIPESETVDIKKYNIVEVIDDNYNSRFFGVEQEKLFNDILNINNSALDSIKSKNYNDGHKQGFNSGLIMGLADSARKIKKLNWFRRLFNLF